MTETQNLSTQQWKGSVPQKWDGGRIHLRQQDQMILDQPNSLSEKERLHYNPVYSDTYNYIPGQRQFDGKGLQETFSNAYKEQGRNHQKQLLTQKKNRPEMLHIKEKQSGHLEDVAYGIRPFSQNNQSRNQQWEIEQKMNSKTRVRALEQQRNGLNIVSLGDKEYRHPDYSRDFYKEGGLVPGQNIQVKTKQKKKGAEIELRAVNSKHIPPQEYQKREMFKIDKQAVDELDSWVENVLKEANPNYKDPDQFFEREEQNKPQQGIKDVKKDIKKPGKK